MNGKNLLIGLSYIDRKFIEESENDTVSGKRKSLTVPEEVRYTPERTPKMGKYENRNGGNHSRRLLALILAACLIFALAVTAYAANWFGIRELFRTYYRELPEAAQPYIQQHTEAVQSNIEEHATNAAAEKEDWSARIEESLCDTSQIMVALHISGGEKYILAPTDVMPEDSVRFIGLQGKQTLADFAASQGKELLFVGASLQGSEELGIFGESQRHESISPGEMALLIQSDRTGTAPAGEVICHVYARNSQGEEKELDIPFTLTEAPVSEEVYYVPVDPAAIPGMTVGEAIVKKSPLGLIVRWMETVTDAQAFRNIVKVEIEGIEFLAGGYSMLEDDGNVYFDASMGQGEITDTMKVNFYDEDKQYIGTIVFEKS